MSRSTQGHHFSKLGSTQAPDDAYQDLRSLAFWFWRRFFRFLPYMAMAAILVMWPFEQTFVPPSHRRSIWNLTLIGPVVSEEKMFKECGRRRTTEVYLSYKLTISAFGSGIQRTTEVFLSYKLTIWAFGSGELKMERCCCNFNKLQEELSQNQF